MSYSEELLPASKKTGVGLQHAAKSLLRNTIRHTDTHNRLLEEAEMWQMHSRMQGREGRDCSPEDKSRRKFAGIKEPQIENSFLYDDRRDMDSDRHYNSHKFTRRAHMDEDCGNPGGGMNGVQGSTYWQRQLLKAEEEDTVRWGHGGFKELYPLDFESDRSDNEGKKKRTSKHKLKKGNKLEKREGIKKRKKSKMRQREDQKHKDKEKKKNKRSKNFDGSDGCAKEKKNAKISYADSVHSDSESERRVSRKRRRKKAKRLREKDVSVSSSIENSGPSRKRKWQQDKDGAESSSETDDSITSGHEDCAEKGHEHSRSEGKHSKMYAESDSRSSDSSREEKTWQKGKRKQKRNKKQFENVESSSKIKGDRETSHRKRKRRK
ncbi:chromosome 11 open reading frame 57 [Plakobranchus ocellatus]|uniref:Chromosome 11 open reading frame 57 n=1 Tax=Plakobranchus ocellatus TaxID=259542 RepID=A0AAV4DS62_9GAST|nr:chromosome 11 open reading frame 57 [Plakobranchus ocellatus]